MWLSILQNINRLKRKTGRPIPPIGSRRPQNIAGCCARASIPPHRKITFSPVKSSPTHHGHQPPQIPPYFLRPFAIPFEHPKINHFSIPL
jgi:hypothetical protein